MALGPAARALSVPGTFSRRGSRQRQRRQQPRKAGGCAPTSTRTADTHVESRRGGARRSTRAQAGSRGHRDARPLQHPRGAPGHARGPGRRGPAAQPPSAAAAHSPRHRRARPRPPWRPGILHRTGACCRCANRHSADSQTKRQLAGPFTISQRRESLSHVAGHPPQHTHTCPHTHTSPHPPAGPGANPHCCWDPRIRRHTLKVITVLHHQVTWRVPNGQGPAGGEGRVRGAAPRQGSRGVGPRGLGLRAGAVPRPRCRPLPPPRLPRPAPPRLARSGANRSPPPARLVCAARFPSRPAVARCLKLCVSGPGCVGRPPYPFCRARVISLEECPRQARLYRERAPWTGGRWVPGFLPLKSGA